MGQFERRSFHQIRTAPIRHAPESAKYKRASLLFSANPDAHAGSKALNDRMPRRAWTTLQESPRMGSPEAPSRCQLPTFMFGCSGAKQKPSRTPAPGQCLQFEMG